MFSYGNQKSATELRMAVILLPLPVTPHLSRLHLLPAVFTKCFRILPSHPSAVGERFHCCSRVRAEGRTAQRHFPRVLQEEPGLCSDLRIPDPLLNQCASPFLSPLPFPNAEDLGGSITPSLPFPMQDSTRCSGNTLKDELLQVSVCSLWLGW